MTEDFDATTFHRIHTPTRAMTPRQMFIESLSRTIVSHIASGELLRSDAFGREIEASFEAPPAQRIAHAVGYSLPSAPNARRLLANAVSDAISRLTDRTK